MTKGFDYLTLSIMKQNSLAMTKLKLDDNNIKNAENQFLTLFGCGVKIKTEQTKTETDKQTYLLTDRQKQTDRQR